MTTLSVPTSAVDPFAPETLAEPYPAWRELRDAGPAVRLTSHPAWVIPRYAEQRAALVDHTTFSSAEGVGLDPVLLGALVRRCSSIAPAGPRERALGPVIRGVHALPVTVEAA